MKKQSDIGNGNDIEAGGSNGGAGKAVGRYKMVCLGASAGGLEALERFFRRIPGKLDVVLVLVQHLSPDYKSVMGELLDRYTHIGNVVVSDGLVPEAGKIHLIPPGKDMELRNGVFRLRDRKPSEPHLPINRFLESMAAEIGGDSVAIILSGTASDGSKGIEHVHRAGGLVMAQSPESSKFDGMPRSAEMTGVVDFIGTPEELADAILDNGNISRHSRKLLDGGEAPAAPKDIIFQQLSDAFSIDFSLYKDATILRRLERRLQMRGVQGLKEYAELLRGDSNELDSLYRDLLIEVTQFFRDPEAFEFLAGDALPELLDRHPKGEDFRVWVAGCATGEEAYSMAMMLDELVTERKLKTDIRIFATDIHKDSLRLAGAGFYSEERLGGVSQTRRETYFDRGISGWTVKPILRRMITFAPHNLLRDPPFLHMSLISCRNMLIYFLKEPQEKVLLQFAAALERGGVLFLGSSESMLDSQREFATVNSHFKIFRKENDVAPNPLRYMFPPRRGAPAAPGERRSGGVSGIQALYPALMEQCMPTGFWVNSRGELMHTFGGAGKYLSIVGAMQADVSSLLHGNLRVAVTTAIERARKSNDQVRYAAVSHPLPENPGRLVDVNVIPVVEPPRASGETERRSYFVRIDESDSQEKAGDSEAFSADTAARARIEHLERELHEARENLQTTVEELETSNEELQATNEELLAANEELQSSNEELQSVNEELHSVNAEYQEKNDQLVELNNDIQNLMACSEIGTIFLDADLRVRRFTPSITRAFFIREQDIGRPIVEIKSLIASDRDIVANVRRILADGGVDEREVATEDGTVLLQRVHPYRDDHGEVRGVAITYIDLTLVKKSEEERRRADILRSAILDSLNANIAVLDREGKIIAINEAWRQFAKLNQSRDSRALDIGANYFAACACSADDNEHHDAQQSMAGIRGVLAGREKSFEMEYPCDAPGQPRWFLLRATLLNHPEGGAVVAHIDISDRKRAENKVVKSEKLLRSFLDSLDALVFVAEIDSHELLFVNEYGRQKFGDFVGRKCWEMTQGEGQAGPCDFCPEKPLVDAEGKPSGIRRWEARSTRNGRVYDCRDQAVAWSDGRLVRIEIATDISARVEMEKELREHRDNLDELVELKTSELRESEALLARSQLIAHVGSWKFDSASGKLVWSEEAYRIFGIDPKEFKPSYEKFLELVHPDDRALVNQKYLDSIKAGNDEYEVEHRIVRRDNGEERHVIERCVHERAVDGTLLNSSGIVQDITERKKAEEGLRQFRQALDNAADDIFIIDHATMKFVDANCSACRNLGYSREELLAMGPLDIKPEMKAAELGRFLDGVADGGKHEQLQTKHRRKDGSLVDVEVRVRPIKNLSGKTLLIANARDITEVKRLNDALRQAKEAAEAANIAKSHFLANMSHEIRTPMNGIIGMADLLFHTKLNEQQTEMARTISDSGDHLLEIINDILDLSKIEAGKFSLESEPFNLRGLVENFVDPLALKAHAKEIEFVLDLDDNLPAEVIGDPGRLRQILTNLLGNAVKFTDQGEVVLSASVDTAKSAAADQAWIKFSIIDTGIGIEADKLSELFSPFVQIDGSSTRRFGGTGLGLSISKKLVGMMGGEIGVESIHGKGANFWAIIPFRASEKERVKGSPLSGKRVLVVDDNQMARQAAKRIIVGAGGEVMESDTIADAIGVMTMEYEAGRKLDAVIVDLESRGMKAEEFSRRVSDDPRLKKVKIIAIGPMAAIAILKEGGFHAFLNKPLKSRLLLKCLDKPGKGIPLGGENIGNNDNDAPGLVARRALVAEDDPVSRTLLKRIMEKLGHHCDAVENGREAIDAMSGQDYDIVFMDCQMPELDGYAATRVVRAADSPARNPKIPIIALTANALRGDREKCLEAGMDDHVAKPITSGQIAAAIRHWTGG